MSSLNVIQLLATLDPNDSYARLVTADALEEDNQLLEAKLLRATHLAIRVRSHQVRPCLIISESDPQDAYAVPGFDTSWSGVEFGGCYIGVGGRVEDDDGNVLDDDGVAGDVYAYEGERIARGKIPDASWYRHSFGLDLTDDEAEELTRLVQRESERVCRPKADSFCQQHGVPAVRVALAEAEGGWQGDPGAVAAGRAALQAAESGKWLDALTHAERACGLDHHPDCSTWWPFLATIRDWTGENA